MTPAPTDIAKLKPLAEELLYERARSATSSA